jgi:protein tyrosine phosphatase (PTP) superfamily phosphohydrolase (DUF442 family)
MNLRSTRSPRRTSLLAALTLVLGFACRTGTPVETPPPYPLLAPDDFGSMQNVSSSGNLWIGGMPSAEDLELAQRRGVELVIDLSVPSEARTCDVAVECRKLGIAYASAGITTDSKLTSGSVDLVLAELRREPPVPTLVFSGTGSRSATYLAIYRVLDLGVPLKEALIEARQAGMQAGPSADFVCSEVARLLINESLIQLADEME